MCLTLKVGAADATFNSTSFKKAEAAFARKLPPLLERLLTFGPRAALAAGVSGFAWVAGSYFSGGQSQFYAMKPQPSPTVVAQESAERAELLRMKQKMAEDIRALQARSRRYACRAKPEREGCHFRRGPEEASRCNEAGNRRRDR